MLTIGTWQCRASSTQHLVRAGADADRSDVAREHERGVLQRLAAGELHLVGAQHDGMPAELVDADLEGDARACRGLLEDQRDAAARERPARQRRLGQLLGARQQRLQLGGRELGACEEMAWRTSERPV